MSAVESLTIEIAGDSSGLSRALQEALAQIESLQSAASAASTSAEGIGTHLAGASIAIQPLQQVGQLLSRISQQSQSLGQTPITLNIQPALSALQSLMSAAQAVAAALGALSQPMGTFGGPSTGGSGPSNSPAISPRVSASASTLAMPTRTPQAMTTMATPFAVVAHSTRSLATPTAFSSRHPSTSFTSNGVAAESIHATHYSKPGAAMIAPELISIRTAFTENVGPAAAQGSRHHLSQNFREPVSSQARNATGELPPSYSSTINHFGGITIEVKEIADVNALMRDLRLQGLSMRHRHG